MTEDSNMSAYTLNPTIHKSGTVPATRVSSFVSRVARSLCLVSLLISTGIFAQDITSWRTEREAEREGPRVPAGELPVGLRADQTPQAFSFNTEGNDFSPTFAPDGSFIVFNGKREGQNYQDLYMSLRTDKGWSNPALIDILNSPYNDETPYVSADGRVIVFSSDRDGSTEMTADSKGRIRVSYDLYWSKLTPNGWSLPTKIPGTFHTPHHERAPALSEDGKTLYFTSWPFGDINESLLYEATWDGRGFTKAKPLPKPINTNNQEAAFTPIRGGNGFLFSSRRPGGFGGWDIYYAEKTGEGYSEPLRLPQPYNSEGNDLHLSIKEKFISLCSDRKDGKGLYDIYLTEVEIQKPEMKAEIGAKFELNSIHFDPNSWDIKTGSTTDLDKLADWLKQNPTVELKITGHTDLHGSGSYNDKLSLLRADAVKRYLEEHGIDAKRLRTVGAGSKQPKKAGMGPGIDELNRRTEFEVLQK